MLEYLLIATFHFLCGSLLTYLLMPPKPVTPVSRLSRWLRTHLALCDITVRWSDQTSILVTPTTVGPMPPTIKPLRRPDGLLPSYHDDTSNLATNVALYTTVVVSLGAFDV